VHSDDSEHQECFIGSDTTCGGNTTEGESSNEVHVYKQFFNITSLVN
jgi:hypothetical protein